MTDTNPYAPPREMDTSVARVNPRVAVRNPAISLIVASIIGLIPVLVSLLANIIVVVGYISGQLPLPAEFKTPGMMAQLILRLFWTTLILASDILILVGAIHMLGLRKYNICRLGAILAIIPCIGPCYLLGIPFGVWAILVLSRPEVREAFDRS